jgi:myosin heavy subunit
MVTYNQTQAQDARDAMVKRVYSELFQYMVNKINMVLTAKKDGKPHHKFIGVLDIFGFESFVVNSFEQLCINYCNEKLQFHFNEHIFRMEQNLYAEEGIVIEGSSFVDNQPTLDLLDLSRTGIFSMCDEEINVPRGSDEGFLNKVLTSHAKHANMVKPKANMVKDSLKNFGILHYAGTVFYNVSNFLEKNKDQLHENIISVLRGSTCLLIKNIFPPEVF